MRDAYHSYVLSVEMDGRHYDVDIHYTYDNDMTPYEYDGIGGVVRNVRRDHMKRPCERFLTESKVYDWQATIAKAAKEGWGVEKAPQYAMLSEKQRVALAVERDFQRLKGWHEDDWYYVCIWASYGEDSKMGESYHCVGGYESDDNSLEEYAYEVAEGVLSERKQDWVRELVKARKLKKGKV